MARAPTSARVWDLRRLLRWAGIAAACALGTGLLLRARPATTPGAAVALLVQVAAVVVLARSLRRHAGPRLVWWCLWAAQILAVLSFAVQSWLDHRTPQVSGPSWGDALHIAAFVPLMAALLLLNRSRHPRSSRAQLLDSGIISVPILALTIVYVILPQSASSDGSNAAMLDMVYPILDAAALTVLVRLNVGGGHRNRALWLISAAATVALVGDLVWRSQLAQGSIQTRPDWVTATTTLAVVLLAAASLSSDAMQVSLPEATPSRTALTPGRVVSLAIGSIALPVMIALGAGVGAGDDVLVLALGAIVVNLLVVGRAVLVMLVVAEQSRTLASLARTDSLTGLPNRRSWDFEVARAETSARRDHRCLTVAILDLDFFKAYNDRRGHLAGDQLLVDCAHRWRGVLPDSAYLARYGGEEFTVLLPDTDAAAARPILEQVRLSTPGTTVSIGYAELDEHRPFVDALADADAALYAAKARGRNAVVAAGAQS